MHVLLRVVLECEVVHDLLKLHLVEDLFAFLTIMVMVGSLDSLTKSCFGVPESRYGS